MTAGDRALLRWLLASAGLWILLAAGADELTGYANVDVGIRLVTGVAVAAIGPVWECWRFGVWLGERLGGSER